MAAKKTNGGSKRLASSLVALGSAVITAVYATGYVRTQAAADQIAVAAASEAAQAQQASATTALPTVTIAPKPSSVPTNTAVPASPIVSRDDRPRVSTSPYFIQPPGISRVTDPTATPAPTSTPSAAAAAPTAATSKYKDGTYTGVGYSRHGGVQATVVVKGGKIVSANVSGCSTRYPCSAVSPLPAEVVSQQTYQVDYVSGATDSSMAYQGAVEQALAQAAA